ncbi:MAG: potassium channel family protein [Chloroflexota bacterium]|nr:potassium channel family protein [Chloroflexota bacterium]
MNNRTKAYHLLSLNSLLFGYGFLLFLAWIISMVESNAGGGIDSFWVAVWWAVGTITTVGYGDVTPVTTSGRVLASVMMLLGIGVSFIVLVKISLWYFQPLASDTDQKLDKIYDELRGLREHLEG